MADRAPHIEAALKWFGEQEEEEQARIIAKAHSYAFATQSPRERRFTAVRITELVEVQAVSIDVASSDGRTTGAITVLPHIKEPECFTVRAPGPLEAVLNKGDLKMFSDALRALIDVDDARGRA